ncbi:hypothetical protein A9498_26760 [Bacillus thuringiensis serovar coreanensis]|nr:hypothetical protein A9498_26760 [Bacillus thuringiensis serovar coreanensis]
MDIFLFLLGWIIGVLTGLTERLSDKIKKRGMNMEGQCEHCECEFEVGFTDYLLSDEPYLSFCPNCGQKID